MPRTRARRQSPATPLPAPISSTRSPSRAGTAAASNTASLPARCPFCGWTTLMRPPRKSSVLVAPVRARCLGLGVVGDDMADAGPAQDLARVRQSVAFDQNAPGQGPDRAFEHAHIEVGDDEIDVLLGQQCADIGQKDRIVRPQQFLHGLRQLLVLETVRLDRDGAAPTLSTPIEPKEPYFGRCG